MVIGRKLYKVQISEEGGMMVYFQVDLESVIGDLETNVELTHIVTDAR